MQYRSLHQLSLLVEEEVVHPYRLLQVCLAYCRRLGTGGHADQDKDQ